MVSWEIVLSKGQEWDWIGDPFFRVQTLLALFALGLSALVLRELRIRNPLINFRTLADQNFRWSCVIIFCAFGVLYANTTTLPALLQSPFGYDATTSGLVLSPSGPVGRDDALRRWTIPLAWGRCALADSCGVDHHGNWKLLDVADEPRHQLVAGRLAALRGDWRAVDDLRPT